MLNTGRLLAPPANPGAANSALIYDTGAVTATDQETNGRKRVRTACYVDQAATFLVQWAAPGSSNLRTVASVAINANDYFQRDVLLQPGRTRITIVTVTGPSVWEVGVEVLSDPALAQ